MGDIADKDLSEDGVIPKGLWIPEIRKITLEEGTDYQVTYSDNVNVGTASAVITGMGGYILIRMQRAAANRNRQ